MIILKHLTIERFRLLRSMNLHFPQRGSILISGTERGGQVGTHREYLLCFVWRTTASQPWQAPA